MVKGEKRTRQWSAEGRPTPHSNWPGKQEGQNLMNSNQQGLKPGVLRSVCLALGEFGGPEAPFGEKAGQTVHRHAAWKQ